MKTKRPKHDFLESALAEICELYKDIVLTGRNAILSTMDASMPLAIKMGGKLLSIRNGHKGHWMKFSKRLPFSLRTAQRYIKLYERRDELRGGMSLTEAYGLFITPAAEEMDATAVSNVNDVKQLPEGVPSLATAAEEQQPADASLQVGATTDEQQPTQPRSTPTRGPQPMNGPPVRFHQPTPEERSQIDRALEKQGEVNKIIEADGFTTMVWRLNNTERWRWVKTLQPVSEFHAQLARTTVQP